MATADQYAEWIVKNQSKKGTPEFETVAEAYKLARSEDSAPVAQQEQSFGDSALRTGKNIAMGALKGASRIGVTLMRPFDSDQETADRTQAIDSAFSSPDSALNADTDSLAFQGGDIAAQIAGTAGAGGALGKVVGAGAKVLPKAAPVLTKVANSLASGGLKLGSTAATTAGKVGNAAIRVGGGAAGGAASAAMIDQENTGTGAVIGGAFPVVGKVAGEVGKKVGGAISANVTPEVVKLAEKAKSLGINIPADRLANSKPLNAVASSLNYVPFSGRAKTEELFEKQLNTALSKTFGQNTDNITMGLRKAADDLGHKFDNTLKSNSVKFDKQMLDDIAKTQNQAATELSDSSLQIINRQIDDIVKKGESGVIDGQAAYNIKRTLDRIGKGNNPEAYHARQLKKDLMAGLDRSLGKEGAKEFAKVRQQYGTMMDLENIAQNGAEGGISIARLANMKNINNPELQDLADIAAQFLKPRESQHGAMQRVLVGGVAGSTAGLPALAGGAIAGRLTNKALNSETAKRLALGQVKAPTLSNNAVSVARTVPLANLYD